MKRILLILILAGTILSCQKQNYQAHFHVKKKEFKRISEESPEIVNSEISTFPEQKVVEVAYSKPVKIPSHDENLNEKKKVSAVKRIAKRKVENLKNSYSEVKKIVAADERVGEPTGTWGFVLGIIGLFILGLPLGIAALILGAVSLGKHGNNPGKYKGQGLAIAALILGIIDIVGALIAISMLT